MSTAAIAVSLAIAHAAAVLALQAGSVVPALWTKAVEIYEANKNLVPGTMTQTVEELDGDAAVKSSTVSALRFSPDPAAEQGVATEIVSVVKDGKDVTAEQRKELDKQREKRAKEAKKKADKTGERSHSVSSNDSPFNPDFQKSVAVTERGARETIAGRGCAAFDFTYARTDEENPKAKPYTVKGTAWLDEETGAPLKVESTRDPLPRGAKRMSSTFLYEIRPDGSWVLKEMVFEGAGGILFIKKSFRMKASFADHWLYEEPEK
ncbi:MAG: hypothetical protein C4574_07040 [Candidatus Latescibacterota bacterium]|jgi:hypothetical protein|nr:MAG: hypothetical protein C4574_07040 [Candidatus Latescibacterota bacterium]